MRMTAQFFAAVASLALAASSAPALAQTVSYAADVEPEAREALDRMGAALRQLTSFTLHSDITKEMVLDDGQKIQTGGTLDFTVRRPNGMKLVAASDRQNREIFYNGKTVTIFAPVNKYYGTVDAPGTLAETLDRVQEKYGLEIPLADFFKFGLDQAMTSRIKSGFVVGTETINNNKCVHYAFRQEKVDWQVWIRQDASALPCKLIITTTSDPSMPQFTAVTTWNTQVSPDPSTFEFRPPEGAKRIAVAETTATGQ